MTFYIFARQQNSSQEKKNKTVKEVLLNLLKESDAVEQQGFNITDQKKGITVINHYKEITKTKNKQANKQTNNKICGNTKKGFEEI